MACMERILTNDFSWSRSRDEKFRDCLRAYYLHYYRSWGGWEPDAPDDIRRLYVLKKLSNRYNWAGSVVHYTIRHTLLAMRFGRSIDPPPAKSGSTTGTGRALRWLGFSNPVGFL